jgi:hypothetical protein
MSPRRRESTVTLLARRASHYLYDRRTRLHRRREPAVPFPGLHESLAMHLASVLPARVLARMSLPAYLAWTARLARAITGAGHAASRAGLAVRAVLGRGRAIAPPEPRPAAHPRPPRPADAEADPWRADG